MMSSKVFLFSLLTAIFSSSVNADPVPSLDDIDDYNDPVLKEIFSKSAKATAGPGQSREETEPPPSLPSRGGAGNGGVPRARARGFPDYESNTNYPAPQRGLPPIERPTQPSQPSPSFPNNNGYSNANYNNVNGQSPYYQVGAQFGQLARSGASVFYQGAQQVGQAFGIQPYQYEVPLLNAAAGLLGR